MAKTKQIIDLGIKAHILIDGSIDEQAEVLTMIKEAHHTGDYSKVLARATVDGVKAETKRRRFDTPDPSTSAAQASPADDAKSKSEGGDEPAADGDGDLEVPAFLKR